MNRQLPFLNALIAETLMLKDNPTFADVLETIDSLSISSRYDELVTTDLDEKFKFLESKDRSIMLPPTGGLSAICLSKQRAACSALCIPL